MLCQLWQSLAGFLPPSGSSPTETSRGVENRALSLGFPSFDAADGRAELRPVAAGNISGEAIIFQPLEWCSPDQNSP